MAFVGLISAWESALEELTLILGSLYWQALTSNRFSPQATLFLLMMGIGKNTTSKSMEAGSSAEGKYEDEAKHPSFFTLPVTAFPVFLSS